MDKFVFFSLIINRFNLLKQSVKVNNWANIDVC